MNALFDAIVTLGLQTGYLKAIDITPENEDELFAIAKRDREEAKAARDIALALAAMREALVNESMSIDEIRQAPNKVRDNDDALLAALILLLWAVSDIGVNASAERMATQGLIAETSGALITAQTQATQRANVALAQIADTLTQQMRDSIAAWEQSGLGVEELVKRLDDVVFSQARAEMIATTEGTGGFAIGTDEMARLAGVQIMQWYSMRDERVCQVCAPMDGKRRYINGRYPPDAPVQNPPPAHPRCRCGEVEILTGEIMR
jgi:SPP1 gp7 family putative phage head morphogenesis protein